MGGEGWTKFVWLSFGKRVTFVAMIINILDPQNAENLLYDYKKLLISQKEPTSWTTAAPYTP